MAELTQDEFDVLLDTQMKAHEIIPCPECAIKDRRIAELEATQKMDKCVAGCSVFTNNERKHHKSCPNYPGSLSQVIDELQAKLDRVRGLKPFVLADDQTFAVYYDELESELGDETSE
jgi:hypothetical protein